MDKLDIILEKLNSLERIESDVKALRADNKEIHNKIDKLMEAIAETKEKITSIKRK